MAKTAVADVIIPTEFEKYAIERTAELSRFGESGIVEMAPEFDELTQGGGREVKMPFWKDLTAARQVLTFDLGGLPDQRFGRRRQLCPVGCAEHDRTVGDGAAIVELGVPLVADEDRVEPIRLVGVARQPRRDLALQRHRYHAPTEYTYPTATAISAAPKSALPAVLPAT